MNNEVGVEEDEKENHEHNNGHPMSFYGHGEPPADRTTDCSKGAQVLIDVLTRSASRRPE
jgi:hypothetical protein